jgi:hypothetical protein
MKDDINKQFHNQSLEDIFAGMKSELMSEQEDVFDMV